MPTRKGAVSTSCVEGSPDSGSKTSDGHGSSSTGEHLESSVLLRLAGVCRHSSARSRIRHG